MPTIARDLWRSAGPRCCCASFDHIVSTSVSIAERRELDPLYYFWRQLIGAGLGLVAAAIVMRVPLRYFEQASTSLLFLAIALLVAVLVPGLGREVNGSMRWRAFGPLTGQASEIARSRSRLSRGLRYATIARSAPASGFHQTHRRTLIGALFAEPDFGAAVVLTTGLGMLFAGVPILRFFFWGLAALVALASLSMLAPYRLQRLMTFMDPWSDPFNTGFQLTQALIAFGRGEWLGVGLGNSVQKLFYLPEVHTDFVFAVIGEEVGLIGTIGVIALFLFVVWRIFYLGGAAERANLKFAAYVTYGIGLLIGIQAFFNIGVNMGLLPTKGLPLPFLSYASNNLVMTCSAIGIALRAGYEARNAHVPSPRHGATP